MLKFLQFLGVNLTGMKKQNTVRQAVRTTLSVYGKGEYWRNNWKIKWKLGLYGCLLELYNVG